jgi:hypothetical protein
MASQLYTGDIRTIGESMARSTTEVHAFKIFMDEPPVLGGATARPARWTLSWPRTAAV